MPNLMAWWKENDCPAELLISTKLRSTIPCNTNLLQKRSIENRNGSLKEKQSQQQKYYNRSGTVDLLVLAPYYKVYIHLKP